MLPLLSGSWYNGMDTSETVDVCSALMKKASPGVRLVSILTHFRLWDCDLNGCLIEACYRDALC